MALHARCSTCFAAIAAAGAIVLLGPALAHAQWVLSLDAEGALSVSAPQSAEFGPGASAGLGVHRALLPWLLLGVRVRGMVLSDGAAPVDPSLADRGAGGLVMAGPSVRFRPLAAPGDGGGLFIEGSTAASLTGELTRVSLEVGAGWLFQAGPVALGPTVRYVQVVQPQGGLEGRDARLALVGIEGTLFDSRPTVARVALDPDLDGDGIPNERDACPRVREDSDGFEDADGCPDRDNDHDGLYDHVDRCPNDPEDVDDFEDADGCPDPDNDGDGILDGVDACPLEPEIFNGVEDADGCPDEGLVELVGDRVVLEDRVLFDLGRARVRSAARPIVQALARLVGSHPEWSRLRVEGHADVRGSDELNLALTGRRARNVLRALVEAGVPARLLSSEGFGRSRPVDPGTSDAAHARNRRVEFVVETAPAEAPR
jgi:outer membrane protein OmpA-like peptidoglycan-associated protein